MANRKKVYYMDLTFVENGCHLNPFQQLARNRLMTTHDWDNAIFWLDLQDALEVLNDYQRDCFVSNLIEGYTKQEISDRLGVSRQAVLKQVRIARNKIRNFLSEGYETP